MVAIHGTKAVHIQKIFLRSMLKKGFWRVTPGGLGKGHPALNIMDWCHKITNKETVPKNRHYIT